DLFNSSTTDFLDNEINTLFPPVITVDENSGLTRNVDVDEIKLDIRQMGSLKAPGPDGLQ
ncbi:hypothetical protein MKX03_025756, partial [Papaver bracteatum]